MKNEKCFLCGKDNKLNNYKIGAYEISCEDCGKVKITYCCLSNNSKYINEETKDYIRNYIKNNNINELIITNHNISNFLNKKVKYLILIDTLI